MPSTVDVQLDLCDVEGYRYTSPLLLTGGGTDRCFTLYTTNRSENHLVIVVGSAPAVQGEWKMATYLGPDLTWPPERDPDEPALQRIAPGGEGIGRYVLRGDAKFFTVVALSVSSVADEEGDLILADTRDVHVSLSGLEFSHTNFPLSPAP